MQAWAKKATEALQPKKRPVRYGTLQRKDGIVRTFEGVTAHGYREELGGTFFYVEHAHGTYELAAENLDEFQAMEQRDEPTEAVTEFLGEE